MLCRYKDRLEVHLKEEQRLLEQWSLSVSMGALNVCSLLEDAVAYSSVNHASGVLHLTSPQSSNLIKCPQSSLAAHYSLWYQAIC